jgi:hypothetical protein
VINVSVTGVVNPIVKHPQLREMMLNNLLAVVIIGQEIDRTIGVLFDDL